MSEPTKIMAIDNGPFLVTGAINLSDAKGQLFSVEAQPIALCRCGTSANRPFCDGSHKRNGFQSSERAV